MSFQPEASSADFSPHRGGDRLFHLDVVRGFALLGVLVINNHGWLRAPSARYELTRHPWPGALNAWTEGLLQWLLSGKSMNLFALLFGLGLTLQMTRAQARSAPFVPFALRRQGTLALIGMAHLALLWSGDILHGYAVLGFALLPFLRCRTRTLLLWAACFQAAYLAHTLLAPRGAPVSPPPAVWIELSRQAYLQGSWLDAAAFRWREMAHVYERIGGWFWSGLFSMFLLGSALWRSGIIQDPEAHLQALRRGRTWGLGAGLLLEGLGLLIRNWPGFQMPPTWRPWLGFAFQLGEPILALGYLSAVILLVRDPGWAARLRGLAAMGRLILSNYLLQSLVLTWIYNGYGLGLYDRLGPFVALLLALALYAIQIALSLWWTARFHFGPVEWLWRGLSYGTFPPLKKPVAHPA